MLRTVGRCVGQRLRSTHTDPYPACSAWAGGRTHIDKYIYSSGWRGPGDSVYSAQLPTSRATWFLCNNPRRWALKMFNYQTNRRPLRTSGSRKNGQIRRAWKTSFSPFLSVNAFKYACRGGLDRRSVHLFSQYDIFPFSESATSCQLHKISEVISCEYQTAVEIGEFPDVALAWPYYSHCG